MRGSPERAGAPMLTMHRLGDDPTSPPVWLDLFEPNPEESAQVEALIGSALPTRADLSEVERSSRLRARDGVLSISVPITTLASNGEPRTAPVGFVLSRDRLVTVRFAALRAFDAMGRRFETADTRPGSGLEVFVQLCDEIIDRVADSLEQAAAELHDMSLSTFHASEGEGNQPVRSSRSIRAKLRHVGRIGDRVSAGRDALLGMGRAIDFASGLTADWSDGQLQSRMKTLRQDVASLNDYQVHLSDKVQFLLDAMVGLISIAQNDVFKILTIVSIAGIPPTLIAGIYGMNFKGMPEYDWSWGYPFGLTAIAVSAIIPLIWFKVRGWF
ncbi:MAG TPA: magnesium transporter CorA family protein [Caulobacteraceae bacterium]|jgi:magnesium transporter